MPFATVSWEGSTTPLKLHYIKQGPEDSRHKIVFLNGLMTSSGGFEMHALSLVKKGYEVLRIDNPGVGKSEGPGGRYKTNVIASSFLQLMSSLGWGDAGNVDGVHIIGCSLGGMVSQCVAAAGLKQAHLPIKSLTIICSSSGSTSWFPFHPWGLWKIVHGLLISDAEKRTYDATLPSLIDDSTLAAPVANAQVQPDQPVLTHGTRLHEILMERINTTPSPTVGGIYGQAWAALTHNLREDSVEIIKESGIPILCLVAEKDYTIPNNHAYDLAKILGAKVEVYDDGHGFYLAYSESMCHSFHALINDEHPLFNDAAEPLPFPHKVVQNVEGEPRIFVDLSAIDNKTLADIHKERAEVNADDLADEPVLVEAPTDD